MRNLPNGCSCSELTIYPKNWKSEKASLKKDWYVQYRFYDPAVKEGPFAKGKLRIVKGGINTFKDRDMRRRAVDRVLIDELYMLERDGFNPITGHYIPPPTIKQTVEPSTYFGEALQIALDKLKTTTVKGTYDGAKIILPPILKAARVLRIDIMQISKVKCQHLTMLLDFMQDSDKAFSNCKYNRYRSCLVMLFKRLFKFGAVESNQVELVERRKTVKRIRTTLTAKERKKVDEHLRTVNPELHRFMIIFFHAGVRETEILQLKVKDVDLEQQRYKVVIKKGSTGYHEVWKVIKNIALPYWKQAVENADPEHFVFSKFLKPGAAPIDAKQISRRWRLWVKKPLKITADFYSLKHSNTTETVDHLGEQHAAEMNSHLGTAMVVNIYDTKQPQRKEEKLKQVNNPFV